MYVYETNFGNLCKLLNIKDLRRRGSKICNSLILKHLRNFFSSCVTLWLPSTYAALICCSTKTPVLIKNGWQKLKVKFFFKFISFFLFVIKLRIWFEKIWFTFKKRIFRFFPFCDWLGVCYKLKIFCLVIPKASHKITCFLKVKGNSAENGFQLYEFSKLAVLFMIYRMVEFLSKSIVKRKFFYFFFRFAEKHILGNRLDRSLHQILF